MTHHTRIEPRALRLEPEAAVPNNPDLPVLLYKGAVPADAGAIEARLAANGWPAQWRDGIFAYHHWHAEGHEVLALARGAARVVLGGPGGPELELEAGDVVVLPAGTGHCRVDGGGDLLVVGGYPPGQTGDIRRDPGTAEERARLRHLPFPASDPVTGPDGPLPRLWASTDPS